MCYRFQRPVYVQKKRTLVIEEIEIKYNFQEENREEMRKRHKKYYKQVIKLKRKQKTGKEESGSLLKEIGNIL